MQIQCKLRLKELQREFLKDMKFEENKDWHGKSVLTVGNLLHNLRKLYINEMVIQELSAVLK